MTFWLNKIDVETDLLQKLSKPVYLGKTLRVFLSYSYVDRGMARDLKSELEPYGIEVFLAHEDILPSTEWQEEIVMSIKGCDVFIPILTASFSESSWTDQQIYTTTES